MDDAFFLARADFFCGHLAVDAVDDLQAGDVVGGGDALFDAGLAFEGFFDVAAGEPFAREVGAFEGGGDDGAPACAEVDLADLFGGLQDARVDLQVGEDVLRAVEFDVAVEVVVASVGGWVAPDAFSPGQEARDHVGEFEVAAFFDDFVVAGSV